MTRRVDLSSARNTERESRYKKKEKPQRHTLTERKGRKAQHQQGFRYVKQEVWGNQRTDRRVISVCFSVKSLFLLL